ncbi:hypothetical protein H5410_056386 [Solanum commersonii]|uniref:Uncharacterized protein n=1 Tax=Solanum commersonii TaxID=4109 RepID=A0A9J5WM38_SOLCO|nr:hypothetical protein H5410_056386 [Solanum commersonii]
MAFKVVTSEDHGLSNPGGLGGNRRTRNLRRRSGSGININLRGCIHRSCSHPISLFSCVLCLYALDIYGRYRRDIYVPLLITRNSSTPVQLCIQDREGKRLLALLGSHGHLLLNDES